MQEAEAVQLEKRREKFASGEIAGAAEQHQHARAGRDLDTERSRRPFIFSRFNNIIALGRFYHAETS